MLKESYLSLTLVLIYYLDVWMKIKRCGEMARKLRFFKDQMSKAGVSPKEFLGKDVDIDLDDVEVNRDMPCLDSIASHFLHAYSWIPSFPFFRSSLES